MSDTAPHIFLIAGEPSGDLLGGRLMAAIKESASDAVLNGIGGTAMEAQGLVSLFPMEDLSVMGLAEVLPRIPLLVGRIDETVDKVLRTNPDVVVTIDSPDFCFRVVKKLRRKGFKGRCIHYVAPSVWAWRPRRAKKIAKFLDHLLCVLPFEPPYFEKEGLAASYIGHSVIESDILKGDGEGFRIRHALPDLARIVLLLPGSRHSELDRHTALFLNTAEKLAAQHSDLVFVIPTLPHLRQRLEEAVKDRKLSAIVIEGESVKYDAFAAAEFAIAASGTVALELGYAGVPAIVSYRMSPLTGMLIRFLAKTPYAALPNIILNDEIMPELLLGDAVLDNLSHMADCFLSNEALIEAQKQQLARLQDILLSKDGVAPSDKAARIILAD